VDAGECTQQSISHIPIQTSSQEEEEEEYLEEEKKISVHFIASSPVL
jgi:hypothetical protein